MEVYAKFKYNWLHTDSGVFTTGPLGPCPPPLNSEKFLHMAKNATLEEFDSQENS